MKHIVYKTINIINNKFYIGVHSTDNLNDGYLGSGIILLKAIKKYGRINFSREILKEFNTKEAAYLYEAELLNDKLIKSDNCYNLCHGGLGGDKFKTMTDSRRNDFKKKQSKSQKLRYEDPAQRDAVSKTHAGISKPRAVKDKIKKSNKQTWTPERKAAHAKLIRERMNNSKLREHLSNKARERYN